MVRVFVDSVWVRFCLCYLFDRYIYFCLNIKLVFCYNNKYFKGLWFLYIYK